MKLNFTNQPIQNNGGDLLITVCNYSNEAERRKAAQKYLQQIKNTDNQIKSMIQEAEALQDKAFSISTIQTDQTRVQTSQRNEAFFVGFINKKADVERKIDQEIERLFNVKLEVRDVIGQVSDDRCKLLLRYRYINLLPWEAIQCMLNLQERAVYNLHKKALSMVADILDAKQSGIGKGVILC